MIRSALSRAEAEPKGWLYSGLIGLALTLSCAACGNSPVVLSAFRTEQQAQEHCPSLPRRSRTRGDARGAELKVFRLRRRTNFLPSAARPYSPRCFRRTGRIRPANVDQCAYLNQCHPPRTDRGGVVQAGGVILTLHSVGR